jgi:hypothetical protein
VLNGNSSREGDWLGHAGKSITDGYDRVREDVEYRKEVARAVGIGFTIPAVAVQTVQRFGKSVEEKNRCNCLNLLKKSGAPGGTRTPDVLVRRYEGGNLSALRGVAYGRFCSFSCSSIVRKLYAN